MIVERPNARSKLYDPSRETIRVAARFPQENLNVAAQYTTRVTRSDVSSTQSIAQETGSILRASSTIGTVAGTIAGGVAGALGGKAIAENIDPTVEAIYWRGAYIEQPYFSKDYSYEDYEPAYRSGWESYDPALHLGWKDRETVAKKRWESNRGATTMTWDQASLAAEDAYGRVNERAGNKSR